MSPRLSRLWITAAVAAAMLLSASVGAIVGASTVPQLHACVQKTTSLMRYVSGTTCKSGEKLLTWNSQGLPGAPGPAGPAASGGILFYQSTGAPVTRPLPAQFSQFAFLKVPAGSYLVTVDGALETDGPGTVHCDFGAFAQSDGEVTASAPFPLLSTSGLVAFTTESVIRVECLVLSSQGAATTVTGHAVITAMVAKRLG